MSILPVILTKFAQATTPSCPQESVFGIPTWYKYLPAESVNGECKLLGDFTVNKMDSLLGIGLAITEILLFIAGLLAIVYIIYGGFRYVLSQGEPENTKIAKDAILNAVIGLVIAVLASTIVRFIGKTIST